MGPVPPRRYGDRRSGRYAGYGTRLTAGRGRPWSEPQKVADLRTRFYIQDPETGDHVSHTASLLSDTAVDPRTGRLYVVWQDSRFGDGGADGVALGSSGDGGRTWSEPVKANRTPVTEPVPDQQTFTVSVEAGRDGTVAVSYSDFRNNDSAAPLFTDRWLARCRPSPSVPCTSAKATWRETRLTPRSYDMRLAPKIPDAASPRGFFLGEQMGLTATRHGLLTVWAAPDAPGSAAVHARSVVGQR